MRQQRDVETVCQVFLFGLHRVALLIFLKERFGFSDVQGRACAEVCIY